METKSIKRLKRFVETRFPPSICQNLNGWKPKPRLTNRLENLPWTLYYFRRISGLAGFHGSPHVARLGHWPYFAICYREAWPRVLFYSSVILEKLADTLHF